MASISSKTNSSPLAALLPILVVLLVGGSFMAQSLAANSSGPIVPAVLVFGDSIVDTGNNNEIETIVKSDFRPYGKDFPGHIATGRFSNGKIVSDFVASSLGVKELLPPYLGTKLRPNDLLTGVSFASAGTGFDPWTSSTAMVISMDKEVEMFKEYKEKIRTIAGEKAAARIINESLYIVCAGSNDVSQFFFRRLNLSIAEYSESLVQLASTFLQELANLGAQKVGVFGVPPVGCVPFQRTVGGFRRDCFDDRDELSQTYNAKLIKELETLNTKLNGTKLVYIDIYSPLLDIMLNPQKYGFKESTKGCCGTGLLEISIFCNRFSRVCRNTSEYVFWDSYHPTQRAYQVIVDELVEKYLPFLT
ncbi:GDSL esterase/lipase At3g14820-like [Typha angustifolia]|uniref:GDSL esterase/lipase At3g14820-like n=1 Tax=Typha angustifolia TaxID=59011 RepID=UPI003C2AB4D5